MRIKALMALSLTLALILPLMIAEATAKKYELTRNSVSNVKDVDYKEISLYRVKLGDSEIDAIEMLVNKKIPGVRIEQVGRFVTMWDQSNPTAPMAGIQMRPPHKGHERWNWQTEQLPPWEIAWLFLPD